MTKSEVFSDVYPFTTENIDGYIEKMDLKEKKVLTVGSSGDQALNAILEGANDITIFDINEDTEKFFKIKKDIILNSELEDIYLKIIKNDKIPNLTKDFFAFSTLKRMNNYMKSKENFEKLKEKLAKVNPKFIVGDIFDFSSAVNETYDRILLSNIFQYLDYYAYLNGYEGKEAEFALKHFKSWIEYLNDGGILQLHYIYGTTFTKNLVESLKLIISEYNIRYYEFLNEQNTYGNTLKKDSILYTIK